MCDYQNLLTAHLKARLGKGSKPEVARFEATLSCSIEGLRQALASHTYSVGKYRSFKIYEPKERDILALEYKDRVVQHVLCDNILEPFLDARLDYDNASCRRGKGTHFALDRLKGFMHSAYNKWGDDYYVLKCDISKYFYSIDHTILKQNLYKYIQDKELLWLLDVIIDSTKGNIGIPIGNMTSQWFAVSYLDPLDRYIRNTLKTPYYTRYMDDFVLMDKSKEKLRDDLARIREFLKTELHLELNNKTQIFPVKNGVDYLGFHSYLTDTGKVIRKVRKKSKATMKRKIKHFNKAYTNGDISHEAIKQSIASWVGHAKHANSYHLRKNILDKVKLIEGDITYEEKTTKPTTNIGLPWGIELNPRRGKRSKY